MTALAPVRALERAVPWPRLGWVAWRRYRASLLATIGVVAVLAAYLLVTGLKMRSVYAAAVSCPAAQSPNCRFAFIDFHEKYGAVGFLGIVLMLLPGLIGVFVGAPILARELETGTFRYTFTQGAGRMRWAVALLVPGAVGVALVTAAFGWLVTWHDQPLVDSGVTPRLHATGFPITGVAAAGWALIGFALGIFAGLLWRRVVPALVTGFAVWFGLAFVASQWRLHYLTPFTTTSLEIPDSALTVDQWWTKNGVRVSQAQLDQALHGVGSLSDSGGNITAQAGSQGSVDPVQYLLGHGFAQVTSYQPDARYWPFQWIEFGWLVLAAVVLLGATLWLLRRRPA